MGHDQFTLKFRFITPILGILTLIGIIFSLYKKPYRWDETAVLAEITAKKVADHDIALAVIVSELKDMSQDIKEIKRAVK